MYSKRISTQQLVALCVWSRMYSKVIQMRIMILVPVRPKDLVDPMPTKWAEGDTPSTT